MGGYCDQQKNESRRFALGWIKTEIAEHCAKEINEIHERSQDVHGVAVPQGVSRAKWQPVVTVLNTTTFLTEVDTECLADACH